ncbi:MAG: GGDEF domain-containing response regulator, partial [Acidimicrobiales bacterium]
APSPRPGTLSSRLSASTTVLVVEDEHDIATFLGAFFKASGYAMVHIDPRSPGEVVAAVDEHLPACVLMDLHLRGFSGMDCYRRLRDEPAGAPGGWAHRLVPVIMVTADTRPSIRLEALDGGIDAFVTKPFNVKDLFELVTERVARAALQREVGHHDAGTGTVTPSYLRSRLADELAMSAGAGAAAGAGTAAGAGAGTAAGAGAGTAAGAGAGTAAGAGAGTATGAGPVKGPSAASPVAFALLRLGCARKALRRAGPAAGDFVLRTVAARLGAALLDPPGVVIGRTGDEELGLVFPASPSNAPAAVADRLAAAIEGAGAEPVQLPGGRQVGLALRCGVAFHPDDAADPDALYMAADDALARAVDADAPLLRALSSRSWPG